MYRESHFRISWEDCSKGEEQRYRRHDHHDGGDVHCVQSEESLMRIAMFCRVGRTGTGMRCSSAQADEGL